MTENIQKQLKKLNEDPVNQLAKESLQSVKEKPSANQLHCLQLAKWGLESGKVEAKDLYQLQQNLDALMYEWNPQKALKFLLNDHDLASDLKEEKSAKMRAFVILDQLDNRLTETLVGYPRPRDLPANFR